jgi:hypothetical protein
MHGMECLYPMTPQQQQHPKRLTGLDNNIHICTLGPYIYHVWMFRNKAYHENPQGRVAQYHGIMSNIIVAQVHPH